MGKKCLAFFETLESAFKQVHLIFWTGQRDVQGHLMGLWVDTDQALWPSKKCQYPAEDKRGKERMEMDCSSPKCT